MDEKINKHIRSEVSATRREYLEAIKHLPESKKKEEYQKFLAMIKEIDKK